jgi:hypothetical protein
MSRYLVDQIERNDSIELEREADALPVVAARHELPQYLDVVVLGFEEAFVEGLLERHHCSRDRTRNATAQAPLHLHYRPPAGGTIKTGRSEW